MPRRIINPAKLLNVKNFYHKYFKFLHSWLIHLILTVGSWEANFTTHCGIACRIGQWQCPNTTVWKKGLHSSQWGNQMRLHRFEVSFGKDMVLLVILKVLSKWEVLFDPKMEDAMVMDSPLAWIRLLSRFGWDYHRQVFPVLLIHAALQNPFTESQAL